VEAFCFPSILPPPLTRTRILCVFPWPTQAGLQFVSPSLVESVVPGGSCTPHGRLPRPRLRFPSAPSSKLSVGRLDSFFFLAVSLRLSTSLSAFYHGPFKFGRWSSFYFLMEFRREEGRSRGSPNFLGYSMIPVLIPVNSFCRSSLRAQPESDSFHHSFFFSFL